MVNKGQEAVKNSEEYENVDVLVWSEESYNIAITKYADIEIDQPVPQSYLDENIQVCWDRITLGGYRLAHLIEYMYPAKTESYFLQWLN